MGIGLITPSELRQALATAGGEYGVVDARPAADYERGHIPGATCISWEQWCATAPANKNPLLAEAGYWGVLADLTLEALGERLAACGLSSTQPIVVYADGPRSKGRDGRIAWMLLYLGATTVYLLDGGWLAWLAAGGAVESGGPAVAPGHFSVQVQEQRRARLPDLKRAYSGGALPLFVDTRCREEFDGYIHSYMPRMGHLPGAVLIPFADLFDGSGAFVSREDYVMRVPPETLDGTRRLVTYCEVGVRASLVALLHELHTGRVVAVYDGSLMEWSLDAELPVEGSSTPLGAGSAPPGIGAD